MTVHVITEEGNLFPIHNAAVSRSNVLKTSTGPSSDWAIEDYRVVATIYGGTPVGNTTIASGLTEDEQTAILRWIADRVHTSAMRHVIIDVPDLLKQRRIS